MTMKHAASAFRHGCERCDKTINVMLINDITNIHNTTTNNNNDNNDNNDNNHARCACISSRRVLVRDFKDTAYPLFESDTLFLECLFVSCLVV